VPLIETRAFGPLEYQDGDVIEFPQGLPGFEGERHFALLSLPGSTPIRYLQSLESPTLGFVVLAVELVDPAYELKLMAEYKVVVGGDSPLAVLAILCLPEGGAPSANLLGPVVINPVTRVGVQAIRDDRRYSAVTPLPWGES
jgi:flagellar assembly factor FliW